MGDDADDHRPVSTPYETPESFRLEKEAQAALRVAKNSRVYWLGGQVISIGRTSDNDVVLDHHSVSKVHAAFREEANGWQVEDTHSTNGTMVNGRRIKAHHLEAGDTIQAGEVEFEFKVILRSLM